VLIIHETDSAPTDAQRSVITIGAYDGVHRGHQAVIAQVRNEAARLGCRSVVVTFDRHPASVVRPESAPKLLTDIDQKMAALAATGVDATFVVRFDADAAQEDPAEFVRRVLVETLRAQLIVVGEDFHFGHKRRGNVALLRELGQKHDFEVVPVQLIARPDGVAEPVSSTSIRRALAGGQVEVAANLLGRPFSVSGVVVHGDNGVYSGTIKRADGSSHVCAINLGRRPTFFEHADHSLLEAHLLDFDGDLYGERVMVTFEHFLRSERKFEGLESIKTQLQLDVAAARVAQLR
jgi:riboflavin kinase/FMN adenylyltransferase